MSQDSDSGFSAGERQAMRARAEELRGSGRGGAKKAEEAQACLDAIAAMPGDEREMAERVHTVVAEHGPHLRPKTWYGMPAYADPDGKVVCFFKPGSKFGTRYATFGFTDAARLDEGELWPTEYAVTSASAAVQKELGRLVAKAAQR